MRPTCHGPTRVSCVQAPTTSTVSEDSNMNQSPRPNHLRTGALAAFVALAALLAHIGVVNCGFVVFDDAPVVTENPHIRHGITPESIQWAFTTRYHDYWHPLPWLSHMVDYQLYGLVAGGHHLTSLVIHMASSAILFLALLRLTKRRFTSTFAALLFAVHPVHVESVAWVVERKDALLMLFTTLTILAYTWFVQKRTPLRYALVLLAYCLALLSKPMAVTLPFVLLLLDFWPLGRSKYLRLPPVQSDSPMEDSRAPATTWVMLVLEKTPLFLMALASATITYVGVERLGSINHGFSWAARLSVASVSYVAYIAKLFWPTRLAVLYPFEPIPLSSPLVVGALALIASVTVFVVLFARRFPHLFVGWFWFAGTLIPVIGVVHTGFQSRADRFMYLPAIGIYLAVAWQLDLWRDREARLRPAIVLAAALAVAVLAWVTTRQTRVWQSSDTLFRRALSVTKNNYVAENNYGCSLQSVAGVDSAMAHYKRAVEIEPAYYNAQRNLGLAYVSKGDLESAATHLSRAVELEPGVVEVQVALGGVYQELGRDSLARSALSKALSLDPSSSLAHYAFGNYLRAHGQIDSAGHHYLLSAQFDSTAFGAMKALGDLLLAAHRYNEATAWYYRALTVQKDADAYAQLARSLGETGKWNAAVESATKAKALAPASAEASYILARTLSLAGLRDRASDEYRRLLVRYPDHGPAQLEFAESMETAQLPDSACVHFARARELMPDEQRAVAGLKRLGCSR